ncbi:MAG: murein peptide amidase A [Burkholderiales bacterium PBB3]|nr:MAG: murein peptide amidase A [Burkholderiales bacterium PBB3]
MNFLWRCLLFPLVIVFTSASYAAETASPSCADFVRLVPNLKLHQCTNAGLEDTQARSARKRVLWSKDWAEEDAKLRVIVVGGIHGDEMSSVSLVFHWMGLARNSLADTPLPISWRFIPSLNPDGLLTRPAKRVNANGVDLNRNFPTPNWARDARKYWETRTRKDPRRWPGSKPLSEPESQFLFDQMNSFKPHLIVSVHAPYGVLDFDGPAVPPSRLGRLYLDQVGIFPGSLGNFGGVHKGVPVVTIELPSAVRTPTDAEMRQMWIDLLRWTTERLGPSMASAAAELPK